MTPTERQRILTEAEKKVSLDVNIDYQDKDIWIKGYVVGAISEHDKARNQAIDGAIQLVTYNKFNLTTDMVFALESLKTT